MHLFSTLLFAASANLDSLVVGLSYGMRRTVIGPRACLLMSAIAFFGTYLSIVLGEGLGAMIPQGIADPVGGVMILGIGLWGLLHWWRGRSVGQACADPAAVQLSCSGAAVLGAALAVNNIALGVGAGMSGLGPVLSAAGSMLFSLLFLWGGNRLGRSALTQCAGRLAEPVAAVLMVILGAYEMLA